MYLKLIAHPQYHIFAQPTIPFEWNSWYHYGMVRINRNELSKKDLDALLHQFDTLLGKLDKNKTKIFLSELLGREERVMLAKRLATVVLLAEGCSEYRVSRILKLSPTTTGKIANLIACGSYAGTLSILKKNKKSYVSILETIDSILHLGGFLPHRVGLDRYRGLNNH